MKIRSVFHAFCTVAAALTLAACGGEDLGQDIDVHPASLEEAQATLAQIDSIQKQSPDDPQAARALEQLRSRLDELNHLVARVEPTPGHKISFYEPQPGFITISETGPAGGARMLRADDVEQGRSVSALYRRVSGGAEPPAALLRAEQREVSAREAPAAACGAVAAAKPPADERPEPDGDGTASVPQELTGSDGAWWVANVCYTGGDAKDCLPNWSNGGWAQYNAKTSFFQVAPYSGNFLSVKLKVGSTNGPTDYLFPGDWGSYWAHSSSFADCWCSPFCACGYFDYNIATHRWDIDDASGDGFHWTYSFKSSCEGVLNCDQEPAQ